MRVTIDGGRRYEILQQLKEAKEDVVTELSACKVHFDGPRMRAMVDVFRRVARLDRQITLSMNRCSGSLGVIVQEAFAVDSVSGISFDNMTWPMHSQLSALCLGMRFRHLESVRIGHSILSNKQAEHLGYGLVTPAASNSSNLKCLHFSRVNFQNEAMSALVSGLRQNSTLQKVILHDCGVTDAQVLEIAEALLSNPSLRELDLTWTGFGVQGMKALANLLSKNRKLETLKIASDGVLAFPIHPLESWKGHPCLEHVKISYAGLSDADLGNLVEVLSTCPRLETLTLNGNKITHNGLELLASKPLPSALRWLSLTNNDVEEEKRPRLILRLLQENPQLWSVLCWDIDAAEVLPEINHFKDLNKSGRILLGKDHRSVPLSLWPLVLERANGLFYRKQGARRANAIFHLLQGPALMQQRGRREILAWTFPQNTANGCRQTNDQITHLFSDRDVETTVLS
jgi:hypothetical protein